MELTMRLATAADADAAVPLVHSAGPAAFDTVFGDASGLQHMAIPAGRAEFGSLGFAATDERSSKFPDGRAQVPPHRTMVLGL